MPLAPEAGTEPLVRLLVAALAGMLIGIEREKARAAVARSRRRRPGPEEIVVKEFPGLRTFTLVSLLGALVSYLWGSGRLDTVLAAVLLAMFGSVIVVFSSYRLIVARMAGITTIVVLLVDFMIGFLSGLGELLLASSTAVITAFLLAIKLPAEEIVGRIRYEEILWALELGVVLVVLGPFFITSELSFYGVSLRSLYLFFALVLATSYIGYVAARLRGGRGVAYTALLAGLANSEATMTSVLRLLGPHAAGAARDIAILVNTSMILRNLFIALVLLAPHSPAVTASLAAALIAGALPALPAWRRVSRKLVEAEVEIENPLSFSAALRSTLIYLAIALLVYVLRGSAGGVYLAALLGGFASSSATIVAVATGGLPPQTAAAAAVLATAAGALNKPIYAYMAPGSRHVLPEVVEASLAQAVMILAPWLGLRYVYPNLWNTAA